MNKRKILKIGKFESFKKSSEIFIGEWCNDDYLNVSRNHFFDDKSYSKAKILDSHKKFLLYYDELEDHVIERLNYIHKKQYPKRYWRILLGNWLNWYIKIIINRFNTVNKIVNSSKIGSIEFSFNKNTQFCSQGTSDINVLCDDPNWNSKLFLDLLKFLKNKKTITINYKDPGSKIEQLKIKKNFSTKIINYLSKIFSREEDIFLIETYLSKFILFKSQLRLFQFPVFWRREPFFKKKINLDLRKKLNRKFFFKHDNLKTFLFSRIFDFIPICILEAYKENVKMSKLLPYPKKTKLIITATNFNSDELFKIWTANKILNSTKYIIMQHGAGENFRFHLERPCEILTPDVYLTWGWGFKNQEYSKKNVFSKFFVTRILKKEHYFNIFKKPKQITLFLPDRFPSRYSWNTHKEYLEILKNIKKFTLSLNNNIQKEIYLKLLKREGKDRLKEFNKDLNFWKTFRNNIKFVNNDDKIETIYRNSKLSIYFYNSTGVLELISLNKPVILILNKNQWFNLPKKIIKDYQDLYKVGIIYKDIKSAALAINKISDNYNKWWYNKSRQKILLKFKNNFARYTDHLDKHFASKIKNIKNN